MEYFILNGNVYNKKTLIRVKDTFFFALFFSVFHKDFSFVYGAEINQTEEKYCFYLFAVDVSRGAGRPV